MLTLEKIISQLCDGDKNSKLRAKVSIKALDLWYRKLNKKQLTK